MGRAAGGARRAPTASCASGSPREGSTPELRRRSIEEIGGLGFDGNAIGGLAIGEDREAMFATTDWATALLPPDRPRYFMGIGDPEGILEVIEAGVDMFDCVLPDEDCPHRQRPHRDRASEPARRALRPRQAPARGGVRLPGLRPLHERA